LDQVVQGVLQSVGTSVHWPAVAKGLALAAVVYSFRATTGTGAPVVTHDSVGSLSTIPDLTLLFVDDLYDLSGSGGGAYFTIVSAGAIVSSSILVQRVAAVSNSAGAVLQCYQCSAVNPHHTCSLPASVFLPF
jgi:hypothetical protein